MIYSNYDFLLALPLFVTLFYLFETAAGQLAFLLIASVVFLAWSTVWNLLPVGIVIVAVYCFLRVNERRRVSKAALAVIVTLLIAQLAYFRYRGFFAASLGVNIPAPPIIAWLAPLGISFYTFEAVGAVVDLARRREQVGLLRWSLFIMFLPHLVAGPIVRYRQLAPQFSTRNSFRRRNLAVGFHLFTVGFCKKLVADLVSHTIDPVWSALSQSSNIALLLALIGFFCQLYLDFSGYTDMGRGIARMLGYRLPLNFRGPAFAVTPSEFYQRWHVSLSSWIRTFVYDTLAVTVLRNIRSRRRQNAVLLIVVIFVMALFGLWHGAAWHYVLFGIAQGCVIVAWASWNRGRPPKTWPGRLASGLLLQLTWLFSLILFRAETLEQIVTFLGGLLRRSGWYSPDLGWCFVALAVTLIFQSLEYFVTARPIARGLRFLRGTMPGAVLVATTFAALLAFKIHTDLSLMGAGGTGVGGANFIYFRF